MPWWAWLAVGGILMALELTALDAAFYLMFIGAAAVLVGIVEASGAALPAWGQWLLFAFLGLASMLLFRKQLYDRLRGSAVGFDSSPAGELLEVAEDIAPGARTRVVLRGTKWDAMNVGAASIEAGKPARVVKMRGTKLDIAPVDGTDSNND